MRLALVWTAVPLLALGLLPPPRCWAQSGGTEVQARGTTTVVAARGGVFVPRGDLGPGALVGLDVTVLRRPRLAAFATLDWVRLAQQDQAFVGPPDYPPALADLIQSSDLVTLSVGAQARLLDVGPAALYAGGALGVTVVRAEFEAFGRARAENDVAPAATLHLSLRGAFGKLAWGVELAWREAGFDLGESGAFGEDAGGGFIAGASAGLTL